MKFIILLMCCLTLFACGGGSASVKSEGPVVTPLSSSSSPASNSSRSSSSTQTSSISSLASSLSSASFSSTRADISTTGQLYGLYVSLDLGGKNSPLGNANKEDAFLKFIRNNGFNYLIAYGLEGMSATSTQATQLASLIKRARSQYGVRQIGAALGSAAEANTVVAYNNAHASDERIDVLNLEYEFWNKTDRAAEFTTTINILNSFKKVAVANNLETEIYIGWITETEGAQIAAAVDRVLVHYYRTDDQDIINYGIERLQYLSSANKKIRIAPIFSAEGPTNTADVPFMGTWLETHPNDQALKSWLNGYNSLNATWKSNLQVMGGTWFVYEKFLDINQTATSHITQNPVNQTACVGDTKVFTVTSSAVSKHYCWEKDGVCLTNANNISGADTDTLTISSVTANDFTNYYARVVSSDTANPSSFASENVSLSLDANCPAIQ